MFSHLQQYGKNCGWYALYSITGDRRMLDCCNLFGHDLTRHVLAKCGWNLEVIWNQFFNEQLAMPKDAWIQVRGSETFLVSDWQAHRVALYFEWEHVFISDPALTGVLVYTYDEFLESRYADTMYLARVYEDTHENAMLNAKEV